MKNHKNRNKPIERDFQCYNPVIVDLVDSSDDLFCGDSYSRSRDGVHNFQPTELGNEFLDTGDFKQMSEAPITFAEHFKFNFEKQWNCKTLMDKNYSKKYFTLNLKLLNAGLQTIPFYKRMDYPSEVFRKSQLAIMNKCNGSEEAYQKEMDAYENRPKSTSKIRATITKDNKKSENNEMDLESAASLAPNKDPPAQNGGKVNPQNSNENADDILEWLDSVLEN